MNKKLLIGIIIFIALAGSGGYYLFTQIAGEKTTQKVHRVGILTESSTMDKIADGFKANMSELGYVDGKNIFYDFNRANFNTSEEQRILKKYVDEKMDLIFAFPTEAALAAKANTRGTNIPVVFAQSMTEENNLVENVRQPGGNITGVRDPGPDVTAKRLEILHELVPQAKKIYINYNPEFPAIPPALQALRPAASSMEVDLVEVRSKSLEDIQIDLQQRDASDNIGIDAILTMGQPLTAMPAGFGLLSEFAIKHKIPIGGVNANDNERNVFSYESEFSEIGRLAATLADKIFKGAPAGTIPVLTPDARLRINKKVADNLGIVLSEGILSQADEIIR